MAVYPSPEAAMYGSPSNMTRLNVGEGAFTQDTAGTIAASNPAAGTFTTGNATTDVRNMRRDVVGPIAAYDSTLTHQIFEATQWFGTGPWPGVFGNDLLTGFLFFSGGVADVNLVAGFGWASRAGFASRDYVWTCTSTGVISYGTYNLNNVAVLGMRAFTWFHRDYIRSAFFFQADSRVTLYSATSVGNYFNTVGFGGGPLYIGTVVGLTGAGGPYNLAMDSRFILRGQPT